MSALKVILGLLLLPVFLYVLVTLPPVGLAAVVLFVVARQ